jgi:hypothetical protein
MGEIWAFLARWSGLRDRVAQASPEVFRGEGVGDLVPLALRLDNLRLGSPVRHTFISWSQEQGIEDER